MKKLCVLASLLITSPAFAEIKVIYGEDNRQDVYQVSNALHLKLAQSTAGLIEKSILNPKNLFDYEIQDFISLERGQNVCASEKFSDQPLAPICSGFLVGPDTIVTAGHCYAAFDHPANVCKNFAWVFDYNMKSASHNPNKNISVENIYNCKSVVSVKYDSFYDFAIIKLDRKVKGREPLKFRSSGKISEKTSLVVIGHPTGLPTKIAGDGKVTNNSEYTRFSTTLDTFHGNSGSAVFDSKTGQVEGILIMGKIDYRPSIPGNEKSCQVVNRCDNDAKNCSAGPQGGSIAHGEAVLRIEKIASLIDQALKK